MIDRAAARLTLSAKLARETRQTKKKAAWLPRRPFLSYGGATFHGRFQNLCTGGLSPSRILIGGRCSSGQSRTGARTVRDGLPSP